jgi:predicted phage terminase large subunit-like protein
VIQGAIVEGKPWDNLNPGQVKALKLFASPARFCLLYGGSRSGKTFLTCWAIITRALRAPNSKHLIVRQEASSARSAIMRGNLATLSVVIRTCFPGLTYTNNEVFGYLTLYNGAEIWVGGISDPKAMEKLLGNEYVSIFVNEASEVRWAAFTLLRSRLAQVVLDNDGDVLPQKFYCDLNPTTRQHWTYKVWQDLIDPEDESKLNPDQFGFEIVNPYDNLANLSGDYIADLEALPARARKRFLSGEYIEDVEDALWRRKMIHKTQNVPDLQRIVVAVDPAITNTPGSDETGIIVAGIRDAIGYVLADDSGKYRPEDWARRAIALYDEFNADLIVAEANQGGDMVASVIRAQRADVPVKLVHATRGKFTRAEPVAALYERGKIFHEGMFEDLENQMTTFTTDFDRKAQGWSPDRVDALVWAFTELFPHMTRRKASSEPIRRNLGTMS